MTDDLDTVRSFRDDKKGGPSAEYRESLKHNQEALELVSGPKLKIEGKLEVCRAVAKDIEIKKVYAQKNPKVPFGQVKVIVRTKNGENEESGFQVWYVPSAWDGETRRHKRFDRNSSPTDQPLVPGAYQMWTRVPGEDKSGKKQPISVGEMGQLQQTVDLPVPRDE